MIQQLKNLIKNNPLAWIIFVLLLLSDWVMALIIWSIPSVFLMIIELGKEKRSEDWRIIFTPIENFIMFSIILADFVVWGFKKIKS